jgi:predicted GNAT family N-acyltransferase
VAKDLSPYQYVLLDKSIHNRAAFSCGEASLDDYIQTKARQDIERRAAVVYIMTTLDEPKTIIGYYTLSNTAVVLGNIAPELTKYFPRYPVVSATLLGRLAVDQTFKGEGHGGRLLKHALLQSLEKSKDIASAMVVVDALHNEAKAFYQKYGFLPLTADPLRLYLHMDTIEKSLK